jgi:hypothetical protein
LVTSEHLDTAAARRADANPEARGLNGSGRPAEPRAWIVLTAFLVLTFWMTFRSPSRLNTHVVGDSGDPLLILWILGWVQHAIPHGWDAIWNTSMYFPTRNTLAYSDSMLSVAIAEWPLRAVFGAVLSLNLIALAAQTATLWFTYRVGVLLTRSWPAAIVGALAFAFSTPLLSQLGHYQLMLTSFLVPLTLLLLLRYLERFRLRYGIGIGLAFAGLTTSATYYGLMMTIGVFVIVFGYLLWFRPRPLWPCLRGLAAGGVVAALITAPVAIHYVKLQDDSYFRRTFNSVVAAHPGDFLSPSDDDFLLTDLPVFEDHAFDRTVENRLFPGVLALVFGATGVLVVVRGLRRRDDRPLDASRETAATGPEPPGWWRSRMMLLIVAAGLVSVLLAFGDNVHVSGRQVPLPFGFFRDHVPGFSGLRATSRFVVLGQCALALCAAFGVRALLGRLGHRAARVTFALLCVFLIAETARSVPLVRVPNSAAVEAADALIARRPAGVVVELPIWGISADPLWAYLEAPRQYVSLVDANDRINGYSGYMPPGFYELAGAIAAFPAPVAMKALDRRHVRYVVLHTRVIGQQDPVSAKRLRRDGVGRYTPATAKKMIAQIPPKRVRRVTRVAGAYVVELRPPRPR